MLNCQADQELIFANGKSLTRLQLTYGDNSTPAGVDDVRWAPINNAKLYVVDNKAAKIYRVTGPFSAGDALASMDTLGSKTFGSVVASFNDGDGSLTPFITGLKAVKGLLFTP